MSIQLDISFPATLPLPKIDYSGSPRNTTLVSPTNNPKIDRRSRTQTVFASVTVSWALDPTQYAAFRAFFETTLSMGTSQFKMELRYPKNSVLTFWACRFTEGYKVAHVERTRMITADLDIVHLFDLPAVAGFLHAPVATAATSIAITSFSSNWNSVPGATEYRLDVSTSPTFASFVTGFQDRNVHNVTTYPVTGLSGGTVYYYRVRAVDFFGSSANSNVISPTTLLSTPTNLLISPSTTNGNIILNWTAGSGPAPPNYEIWRSVNGGAYALVATISGALTTYTHTSSLSAADQWYYEVRSTNGVINSSFTDPAGIFNTYTKTSNTGATNYSLPDLQFCIGTFIIGNEASLTTISVPKLHTCTGDFVLINLVSLMTVTVTLLANVSGGCGVFDSGVITNIDWPALTQTGNFFGVARNASLATFTAPLLVTIGADLQTYQTPSLGLVSMPALDNCQGINGSNSGIASLSLPVLTAIGSNSIDFNTCGGLMNVSFPNLFLPDGFLVSFDSCALDDTSINFILALGVASGTTSSDYELANGTNAAPTGQGITDAATLVGNGNTVNTN